MFGMGEVCHRSQGPVLPYAMLTKFQWGFGCEDRLKCLIKYVSVVRGVCI